MSKKKLLTKSQRIKARQPAKKKAAPKVKHKATRKKAKHTYETGKGEQFVIPDREEPESVTMIEITNVKKLTTKIIVGKKIGKIEARTTLYSVIGVATDIKVGESNYGAWTALVGRFEAERTADGEMFASPLLLLPEVTGQPIIDAVKIHEGVEFALIVSVEPTLSAPGYVYDIQTVVAPRRNDMLAILRATLREYIGNSPSPVL
jgi:hypothetical protein